jgi:hypothetical protein
MSPEARACRRSTSPVGISSTCPATMPSRLTLPHDPFTPVDTASSGENRCPALPVEATPGGRAMAFVVKALFDDDSEEVIETLDDFEAAAKLVMTLADRRLTPLSTLPVMTSLELLEDSHRVFAIAVVRREV